MRITLPSSSQIRSNEVGVIEKKKSMTDTHPDNQKLEKKNGQGDDSSPVDNKRRYTDILFLLLLIASWVAMTGVVSHR